jgi:hypothetical protein
MPKPEDAFAADERDVLLERILTLRLGGMKPVKIAEKLTAEGHTISWSHVTRLIREAAADCRERREDLLDQRFMEQDRRVEWLIALCMRKVRRKAKEGRSIDALLRIAVSLFERQARLHGMDKDKARGGKPPPDGNWLDSAPFESVLGEAERIGLVKPGEFRTAPGVVPSKS